MKRIFLAIGAVFFSMSVLAVTHQTQIHSIDIGKGTEPHLIMLENGSVAFVDAAAKPLLTQLQDSLKQGDWLELKLDDKLRLVSVQTIAQPALEDLYQTEAPTVENLSYDPSIISSSTASSMFRGMRRDYQNESQCYNRAHIWTYEEYQRSGIKSGKLFLFFTSSYIRRYNYHWWFHVTPFVYVGGLDQSNWRTLDRRYTRGPLTTKTWTNIFMHNDALCPVVYKYSDYRNHQQSQSCYLIPTSMYFWQPRDISRQERTGYVKTQYYNSEVNHAYWEAF